MAAERTETVGSLTKGSERLGRRLLVAALAVLLGARRRKVNLPERPKILVVRLDERVGNLLLTLPLLDSLRARFPSARLELLASFRAAALLARYATIDRCWVYRKWALFGADGPFRTVWRLRRARFDVVLDAGNPTDPSATQSILVRLCGARHSVGVDAPPFGRLYSAPVDLNGAGPHEIEMRLRLLAPLPGDAVVRQMKLPTLPRLLTESPVTALVQNERARDHVLLNVGARLAEKQLSPTVYGALVAQIARAGFQPLLAFGPSEVELARRVAAQATGARLAPPTDLPELAHLMAAVRGVITCDTGPMHVAVAVGTPTCGIFVTTDPQRYGHPQPPHFCIDARRDDSSLWMDRVAAWLGRLR